jgi:hypothetical protein
LKYCDDAIEMLLLERVSVSVLVVPWKWKLEAMVSILASPRGGGFPFDANGEGLSIHLVCFLQAEDEDGRCG